jgi:hypothetical protein
VFSYLRNDAIRFNDSKGQRNGYEIRGVECVEVSLHLVEVELYHCHRALLVCGNLGEREAARNGVDDCLPPRRLAVVDACKFAARRSVILVTILAVHHRTSKAEPLSNESPRIADAFSRWGSRARAVHYDFSAS